MSSGRWVKTEPIKLHGEWKIFGEEIPTPEQKYFKLHRETDGRIVMAAVDHMGDPIPGGYFASLTDKGIYLHPHVREEFGFPLQNREGRLSLDTGGKEYGNEFSSTLSRAATVLTVR